MKSRPNRCSRRQFFKAAGAAGLGAALAANPLPAKAADSKMDGQKVPLRPFGKTGQTVSSLSLGGMFDIPNNLLLMRQAYQWGVRYWDTADCYEGGWSEKGIGQYFKRYPDHRKNIFLVSKSDARDPDGMTRLLNRSLKRLQTDYIDLYFVHGIWRIGNLHEDSQQWAAKAKKEGKIRFFGFSTHSNMESCLLEASKLDWIDGIMMTYNYRLMHTRRMRAAVEACAKAGIGLTAMKTQGGGQVRTSNPKEMALAGKFLEQGFTDGQAKLKAVWENPHIASICSQMPNLTLLMSNVAAAVDRSRLSKQTTEMLRQYAAETADEYCAGCAEYCEPAMDNQVPIGDVMRCLMYDCSYGDRTLARTVYRSLPGKARSKLNELDYSAAEKACPRHIAIGRLMKAAADRLA